MSSVGGIAVNLIHGRPPSFKTRVETWEQPGITGYGALLLGQGDAEFDLTTITFCVDNAAAGTHITALINLKGTAITVVDDFGDTYGNCLVHGMDEPVKKPAIWGGHTGGIRVETQWKMCRAR